MKKITLTIALLLPLLFMFTAHSLNTDKKNSTIQNQEFRNELGNYVSYIKLLYKRDPGIYSPIITVGVQQYGAVDIFKLSCFIDEKGIGEFDPSYFTVADSIPVLFRAGVQSYVKVNFGLQKFYRTTFNKILYQIDESMSQNQAEADRKFIAHQPDSMKVWDSKLHKAVKISGKSIQVGHFSNVIQPRSFILIFANGKLKFKAEEVN